MGSTTLFIDGPADIVAEEDGFATDIALTGSGNDRDIDDEDDGAGAEISSQVY